MKKMIFGWLVAILLMLTAAGLVIGAGTAKADLDTYGYEGDHDAVAYVAELSAGGVPGTAAQARSLGNMVCSKHMQGFTRGEMLDYLYATYPTETAIQVVMGAEYHFCPAFDSLHMDGDGNPKTPSLPRLPSPIT